jgi:hypothetical protein
MYEIIRGSKKKKNSNISGEAMSNIQLISHLDIYLPEKAICTLAVWQIPAMKPI